MKAVATLVLLALAAVPATAAPIEAKLFSDRLARLTEIQRLGVVRRAILDGGEACQRPTATRIQGPYKNMIMWTARCAPSGEYAVFIGPNALVQVRRCDQATQLKLPTCVLPPAPAAVLRRR